ncbi:hypothetical protein M9978_09425 [Sphingomonas sp. MG17]|uniref:Uncharacterized protein n=1 Tax=Sphingomonas tagetis TaxID=2949092 RepID=A0A9X2KLI1_9SPHN|nr:hypothetical protein [Sphingomonas tagetis]MCP3730647.1 hypothetical protein [Sphingomonas tagetis]
MSRSTAPDWPGMMQRATAARYCDMTPGEFEGEVASGRLPVPVQLGRGERWHRRALDEALERLAGGSVPDWRAGSKLYAEN